MIWISRAKFRVAMYDSPQMSSVPDNLAPGVGCGHEGSQCLVAMDDSLHTPPRRQRRCQAARGLHTTPTRAFKCGVKEICSESESPRVVEVFQFSSSTTSLRPHPAAPHRLHISPRSRQSSVTSERGEDCIRADALSRDIHPCSILNLNPSPRMHYDFPFLFTFFF